MNDERGGRTLNPPLPAAPGPAKDKLAASYVEDIAKQIAERKGQGKTPAPEDKKD